jgi:hypothetical protein
MLTTVQKESILRRAGLTVPVFPFGNGVGQQQQADGAPIVRHTLQADARQDPQEHWARTIDALFAEYSAARAARSLREAELSRCRDGSLRSV